MHASWPAKKPPTELLAVQASQWSYLDSFSKHSLQCCVSQDAAQGLGTAANMSVLLPHPCLLPIA